MPLLRNLWLGMMLSLSALFLTSCGEPQEPQQTSQVQSNAPSQEVVTSEQSKAYFATYQEVAPKIAPFLNNDFQIDPELTNQLIELINQPVPQDLPLEQQKQAYWFKVKVLHYALHASSQASKLLINKLDASNDITYASLALITSSSDYFRAKQEFQNLKPSDDLIYQAVASRLFLEVDVQDVYYLYPLSSKHRDHQQNSVEQTIVYSRECSNHPLQDGTLDEFGIASACDIYLSTIFSSTMGFAVDFDKQEAFNYEQKAQQAHNPAALYIQAVSQLYTVEQLKELLGQQLIDRPLGQLILKAIDDTAVTMPWDQIVRLIDREEPYIDNLTKGYVLLAIANLYNNPEIYGASITYAEPSAIWAIIDISIEDTPVTLDSKIMQKQIFGRSLKDLLHYAALMNHPWAQLFVAQLYNETNPDRLEDEPFWLTKAAINNMWDSDDENLAVQAIIKGYNEAKSRNNEKAMSYYKQSLTTTCSYYSSDDFACRSLREIH